MPISNAYNASFCSSLSRISVRVINKNWILTDNLEHESDILGKNAWGTFGHGGEEGFDDEDGHFHPSVTPSPTVITVCGNVAVKKPPKIVCHPLPDAFNPCKNLANILSALSSYTSEK